MQGQWPDIIIDFGNLRFPFLNEETEKYKSQNMERKIDENFGSIIMSTLALSFFFN